MWAPQLVAGTENSSQGNELDQDIFEITDNYTIPMGAHRLTLGTKNEFFKVRNLFAQNSLGNYTFGSLDSLAKRYLGTLADGKVADPILRDRITQANLDFLCHQLTLERSAEGARAGRGPGVESSMFKYYGTELNQRRKELKVLIEGFQGLGWEGGDFTDEELRHTREWLRSRANSIEGGSSEVQLNIIAKRVLGLPD